MSNVNENGELTGGLNTVDWATRMKNNAAYPNDTVFEDWLIPSRKEERQIGQQLLLAENEPKSRMKGLIDAGINPLTAAGAIAGAAPSAVPQPAESTNPIGDVVGAADGLASGFNSVAGAAIGLSKLVPEVDNIKADTAAKFAGIGLTNAQTQGVLTDNIYKDEDWLTRLNVQRQQFENMKQELTNMKAIHREIMTHCDEMISQIELNGSVKDYNEALMAKVQEEMRWMKELNDWRISHNLHIVDSGIDGYIFDMAMNGADISQFDNFIDVYSSYRGRVQRSISDAQNASDINAAFDKAFNTALGNSDVAAQFAPFMANIEVFKSAMIELYKTIMDNPKNPVQAFSKMVNLISLFMTGYEFDKHPISKSNNKPEVSHKSRD